KLKRIDAGIRRGEAGVRNVHEAKFGADVVLAAEEVQTESAAGCEVDAGDSFGHLCVGEERAAAEFEIGNDFAMRVQRPFESKGVYTSAVGSVPFLKNEEEGNGFNGIFQAATEETWTVRGGKNQAAAEA